MSLRPGKMHKKRNTTTSLYKRVTATEIILSKRKASC